MSNFNSALFVINEVYADEYVKQHMTPLKVTQALADAGLLAPEPQIIRTREELEALDPDTLLTTRGMVSSLPLEILWHLDSPPESVLYPSDLLPAVVVATGNQSRAAMQALREVK